jgi:hypothetical protein
MGKVRFSLLWTFVFLVAAYDIGFAWYYRAVFPVWELNPLARWIAGLGGVEAVFGFKALLILFAALVAVYCYRSRHWLSTPYTAFVSAVHFLLSLHYLVGQLRTG